jgi:hypothetical protein
MDRLMPRYRRRPTIIEAVQFTGTNTVEIAGLLGWSYSGGEDEYCDSIIIETLNGDVTVPVGEWVIKGVAGEGYPCRDDIFRATYDAVDLDEGS